MLKTFKWLHGLGLDRLVCASELPREDVPAMELILKRAGQDSVFPRVYMMEGSHCAFTSETAIAITFGVMNWEHRLWGLVFVVLILGYRTNTMAFLREQDRLQPVVMQQVAIEI